MSDDDSTESRPDAAAASPAPAAEPAATEERSGVHIPNWLAGALVVVLAFVIGGVGFALGRSTADDGGRDFGRPALVRSSQQNGGPGGQRFPGGPGGPGGQGGQRDGGPQNGGGQNGGSTRGGA
jgi:hypothetical protein